MGLLDIIKTGFPIWDRIDEYRRYKNSVSYRFIRLFEKHGVHPNQIPHFFGHGLRLEDVSNTETRYPKPRFTIDIQQDACKTFAVNLDWLLGVNSEIYPVHYFYKHPEEFEQFLIQLKGSGKSHNLQAWLVVSNKYLSDENVLLFIKEWLGSDGETNAYRYHLCGHWGDHRDGYVRANLAACIAICCKQLGDIRGYKTNCDVSNFARGEKFLDDLKNVKKLYELTKNPLSGKKRWYPADWVASPESFLDGIGSNTLVQASALENWLEFYSKGLMDTKFPEYALAHERFSEALNNLIQ